jgi:hypothetical protein
MSALTLPIHLDESPLEYGMPMKSSMKGDVYSFGVIMLELLTRWPLAGQEERKEVEAGSTRHFLYSDRRDLNRMVMASGFSMDLQP